MGLTGRSYALAAMLGVSLIAGMSLIAQDKFGNVPVETSPNLPEQRIGPNDLVAISVYGAPELTRTARVSEDGWIRLPMIQEAIEARGSKPAQLEERIASALVAGGILVNPVVTVTMAEYHSRPVSVLGAVHRPVTFQAVEKTSLLEALARAEGLTGEAGQEILISRASQAIQRIPVRGLIDAADPALNIALEGGEEIRVPVAGRIFVTGNVKKPGAFRLEGGNPITVLKALALAEGLAPYATKEAYIYRHGDAGSQEVPVPLRRVLDRKSPDVTLGANDIFYVPDNRAGRMTITALERTVGFAASTASGILILSHP
jgi:polysaccharide export outer membrane protein